MSRRHPDYQDDFLPLDRRIHGGDGHFKQDHHLKRFALSGVELPIAAHPGLFPGQSTLYGSDGGSGNQWLNVPLFYPALIVKRGSYDRGLWVSDWSLDLWPKEEGLYIRDDGGKYRIREGKNNDFQAIITPAPPIEGVKSDSDETVERVSPSALGMPPGFIYGYMNAPWEETYDERRITSASYTLRGVPVGPGWQVENFHQVTSGHHFDGAGTASETIEMGIEDRVKGGAKASGLAFLPFGKEGEDYPWVNATFLEGRQSVFHSKGRQGEASVILYGGIAAEGESWCNSTSTWQVNVNGTAAQLPAYSFDSRDSEWYGYTGGGASEGSYGGLGEKHLVNFYPYKRAKVDATEPDLYTAETVLMAVRETTSYGWRASGVWYYDEEGYLTWKEPSAGREKEAAIYDWQKGEKTAYRVFPDGMVDGDWELVGMCMVYIEAVPQGE